jgi:hypothetical protein
MDLLHTITRDPQTNRLDSRNPLGKEIPFVDLGFQLLHDQVSTMAAGELKQIPNTAFTSVGVTNAQHNAIVASYPAGSRSFWGTGGSNNLIMAYNGAAYDEENGHWYFVGGGHRDYGGNEVYRLDLKTLQWARLIDPVPYPPLGQGQAPYAGPISRHTGSSVVWNKVTKSLWIGGYAGHEPTRPPDGTAGDQQSPGQMLWEFRPQTATWTSYSLAATGWAHPPTLLCEIPWSDTGDMFATGATGPGGAQFRVHLSPSFSAANVNYHVPAAYRPEDNMFAARGKIYVAAEGSSSTNPRLAEVFLNSGGGVSRIVLIDRPASWNAWHRRDGRAYDPVYDRLVFVRSTGTFSTLTVWTYDFADKTVRRFTSSVNPGITGSGMWGKLTYIPQLNVFAYYTNPTGNLRVFKLPPPNTLEIIGTY